MNRCLNVSVDLVQIGQRGIKINMAQKHILINIRKKYGPGGKIFDKILE